VKGLKKDQLSKLFYTLYGQNLASLEFEYHPEIENEIYEQAKDFEFSQIVQVLATLKFMEKKIEDERLELAIENFINKLIPQEINYLLRYFYNSRVDIGLNENIKKRLEGVIIEEAGEMNADELSITYSGLALSKKFDTPGFLEYLENMIEQKQKEFTIDTVVYLLNLKTQGEADFFSIKKIAAPVTLNLLKQKNFSAKQYTTLVTLFTALKHYDSEFWREVLSYLNGNITNSYLDVELPDAISYMQLHSSLSVVREKIDIEQEMKLLEE
jgi:hypothetical protein